MFLLIKTQKKREVSIGIAKDDQLIKAGKYFEKGDLMNIIMQFIKQNNMFSTEIKGIIAYQGPASFTGLRNSLSVANAWSYAAGIPAVGIRGSELSVKSENEMEAMLEIGLRKIRKWNKFKLLLPYYGSPANITLPKKRLL